MKKTIAILAASLSTLCFADVPNTFVAGQVATAEAFNQNFKALDNRISSLEGGVKNDSSASNEASPFAYVTANVNGTPMKVNSSLAGYYSVVTPTGIAITVDAEGYPTTSYAYYESNNCSGQPYLNLSQLSKYIEKPISYTFTNPKLSNTLSLHWDGNTLYYGMEDEVIKLHYKSMQYADGNCLASSGTTAASRLLPNDADITGITSVPLIISGVGTPLTITEEVGEPSTGSFAVYANGVEIGTTDRHPSGVSTRDIRVKLNNYDDKTIWLNKDGTYTGGDFYTNETLYYTSSNCTGKSYVEVARDGHEKWLNAHEVETSLVKNNADYYTLSSQLYKSTSSSGSYRNYYSEDCRTITLKPDTAYHLATPTSAPDIPTFSPPITIEGYTEPTPIDSLPLMD